MVRSSYENGKLKQERRKKWEFFQKLQFNWGNSYFVKCRLWNVHLCVSYGVTKACANQRHKYAKPCEYIIYLDVSKQHTFIQKHNICKVERGYSSFFIVKIPEQLLDFDLVRITVWDVNQIQSDLPTLADLCVVQIISFQLQEENADIVFIQ